MQLNQFQSHPFNVSMLFDDSSEEYLDYSYPLDSPELRPISLPMPGYKKSPEEGQIITPDLEAAATALPNSNAFAQYMPHFYIPQNPNQHQNFSAGQDSEPGYTPDSEYVYPVDIVDRKDVYAATPVTYTAPPSVINTGADQLPRKRKASPASDYTEARPQKKATVTSARIQESPNEFYDVSRQPSPYAKYVPVSNINVQYTGAHVLNGSPRPSHHYSTSNASQVNLTAPSPHTPGAYTPAPGFSPSHTTVKTEHSPRGPMTPVPRSASASSPYIVQHPKLVRTSTISQQPSPGINVAMGANVHTHAFNPYAMYPNNKATIRLSGDLDSVCEEWTDEELEARRKIVVFTRSQTGSTIDAGFKVTAPQDWSRTDITVSCIWDEDKAESYVTSVDTIALLEQLIGVRFTVEEKNRIRRNLEGFHPDTVSKSKKDTEEFFKVIMGFPNPKPRNIEKDVKVFPWKVLSHALKKIIGKYSASYSSTASAMVAPTNSAYSVGEHPADYSFDNSQPQPLMSNAMPNSNMSLSYYDTGMVPAGMPAPHSVAVQDMTLQTQPMPGSYTMVPQGYAYGPMPMSMPHNQYAAASHQTAPQPMQPNWAFPQYNGGHQGHLMSSGSAPAHPRHHVANANLVAPAPYHLVQN